MTQHTDLFLSTRHYSRSDYAALRGYCMGLPFATIERVFYTERSPQIEYGLEKYLLEMRDDLIERAIVHNPHLAANLQNARRGRISDAALRILRNAADIPAPIPRLEHPLTLWFKPKTVAALEQEGIKTIAELMHLIEQRGTGWWRPIPRIGHLRAQVMERWLQSHSTTLGVLIIHSRLPSPPPANLIVIAPRQSSTLAPLGSFTTPSDYDGSQGINRATQFCFIQAKNDLEAIEFYLSRYNDQPHTLRAYRKELERLLLWSIVVREKPLSSLLVSDCEAYKTFLIAPCPAFVGPKAARFSKKWKPFTATTMSAKSQRQAIIIIRAAFDYLTGVRYLGGNPWVAVKDPSVRKEMNPIQIHKALPSSLWNKVITALIDCSERENKLASQYRIALAASLLMGDSGLRREETVGARRQDLIKSVFSEHVYELRVLGKGNKERIVPISARTVVALRAHWQDRGRNFNEVADNEPLLAPLILPNRLLAQIPNEREYCGYTDNGLYRLLKKTYKRLLTDVCFQWEEEERQQLFSTTAHHLRHTFGTLSVSNGMPIDVTQAILGHASPATTAIYVQAKQRRIMEEAGKVFEIQHTTTPVE